MRSFIPQSSFPSVLNPQSN
jgi:hypothetical protein